MMDATPLGFPYPECDPPRVKDLSDIAQLQALAEAVDVVVQQVSDDLTDQLISPRAARMREAAPSAWPAGTANPNLDTVVFASADMGDTAAGGIRITRSGWYLVGTYALVIIPTSVDINARAIILRNGSAITAPGDPSRRVSGTAADLYLSTTVELNEGDLIKLRVSSGGAAYNLTSHMWALELVGA
jgi:hypothetical protein